ncbi:uncharacterized protein LOC127741563 [Arachis duranensis]|uniref:Uncharacterized protein LOC127741563 n=1 Tax=Arachis duranensis TaxID=130453 RepID=A0A9C6WHS5_ARADU|nr:uncharacterized protein LOC127741563 [Arachis duranensis]
MRLSLGENNNIQELKNFAEWLLKIDDGLAGDTTDGESIVHIPSDILIKSSETDRASLAPTLDCVTNVNNKMTAELPGQERIYLSSDSVCAEEGNMEFELDAFSPEILNVINCSGLPPHKLVLKVGAQWLLKIGDGLAGDTTDDMLSNLSVENYFKDIVILAPTLDCVTDVNNKMTAGLPGQERVYLSSDSMCAEEENMEFELDAFSPEILNGINCSGLPPHKLVLKVGAPVMLLRNIDQTNGLCNGTRMQVRRMGNHVIECKTLTGNKVRSIVLIPRLNLIPNNETLPVRYQRIALNCYSGIRCLKCFSFLRNSYQTPRNTDGTGISANGELPNDAGVISGAVK